MPFKYINTDTFNYFNKIMNECDDYQSAVEIPQFYIYIRGGEYDEIDYDEPLWQCDYNKIWEEESKQTIISYINGEHTEGWIDDDEGRWNSIELYFDDCRDNGNRFEYIAQLVDFVEVRKERKKYAMNYLKKVLPKYIRHHLYKPKAIGAKKAEEEFIKYC